MLEDFNTKEKLDDLFKKAHLPAGMERYLIVYSTWPTSAQILGGAGTQMTANVDSAYGGYLVQVCETGLNLIPLVKKTKKGGVNSVGRMEISSGRPLHLSLKDMVGFKNRPSSGIILTVRDITITMDSGKKYVWMINKKEKNLPYHEDGLKALIELGKKVRK